MVLKSICYYIPIIVNNSVTVFYVLLYNYIQENKIIITINLDVVIAPGLTLQNCMSDSGHSPVFNLPAS